MKALTAYPLSFKPKPPFDFAPALSFLHLTRADGTLKRAEAGTLTQALQFGEGPVLVQLRSQGTVQTPRLEGTLYAQRDLGEDELQAAKRRIRFYLGLDDDLSAFYALAEQDAAFAPVLERLYGYHQVRFPSLFSCVCWALVTQRTPNSFAFKTVALLSDLLGDSFTFEGRTYTTFPEPQRFLTGDAASKILAATNNTRKTERLIPLARDFLSADETFLRTAPYDEVFSLLKRLPGLGPWSAEFIMLRGLGRWERAPWTDTRLLEAISAVYTGGLGISRGDARALAERYGWQQGLWVHYLKEELSYRLRRSS